LPGFTRYGGRRSTRNKELLRLDFGIFVLHAMLTASFLVVPELLHEKRST
jgi:hypothetical protein